MIFFVCGRGGFCHSALGYFYNDITRSRGRSNAPLINVLEDALIKIITENLYEQSFSNLIKLEIYVYALYIYPASLHEVQKNMLHSI